MTSIEIRKSLVSGEVLASPEMALVEALYGQQRALRSGVPLIHHIYEGLVIMAKAGASTLAQRAFCLHPLVQDDSSLAANFETVSQALANVSGGLTTLALAMEYRSVANEYLAHKQMAPGGIRLSPLRDVNQMLLGDKVQNQRDFGFYQAHCHPNAARLTEYFEQWVRVLRTACGVTLTFTRLCADLPQPEITWRSPLALELVPTDDGQSFSAMKPGTTGLPLAPHPGAFGVTRKHHVHEGVDLYCPEGTPVYAVEGGRVVGVKPFTGPAAGMPWWHDTQVVLVDGLSGVVAYGEVDPAVSTGELVQTGDLVGKVRQVLRNDKGRPMSMLHLELHKHGARACPEWLVNGSRPQTLMDPTPFLREAHRTGF